MWGPEYGVAHSTEFGQQVFVWGLLHRAGAPHTVQGASATASEPAAGRAGTSLVVAARGLIGATPQEISAASCEEPRSFTAGRNRILIVGGGA